YWLWDRSRTFASRFRPILPCRIIARFRWRRPRPFPGKIDCRSPRRISHDRERDWSRNNGQTDVSASAEIEVIAARAYCVAGQMTKSKDKSFDTVSLGRVEAQAS